jgi:uncharacterized membrane protein (DUF485 family)
MDKKLVEKIENNPSFKELVHKRSGFAWKMTIVMLIVYYAFILTIAFSPETLGKPLGEGVMSVGIPVGIALIIFSFIMAGIYTFRANGEFDTLTAKIKEDVKGDLS